MAEPRMMKAVYVKEYVKDLNELETSLVPVPIFPPPSSSPESTQPLLLIRITHTSPTHVDTLYARGLHQNNHARLVHPPFTLGLEFAGVVVDVQPPTSTSGSNANTPQTAFQKGDKVWGAHLGCFAPFIICPVTSVHHLPSSLSLAQAAGLGASTAPVSYGALCRVAGLEHGETVLVHAAAGGLGVAAVRIARAIGANVIGTVGSEEKARVVKDMLKDGASKIVTGCGVVRYDREGWEKEVVKIANGKGVDVVFDTVGLVQKSIRCCKFGGRIVIVGFVGLNGKMEQVAMNRILLKGVKVFGYRFGETARQDPDENRKTWEGFDELLNQDSLEPVVYKTYKGLDSARDALQELAARKVYGKVVVEVTEEDANADESMHSIRLQNLKL